MRLMQTTLMKLLNTKKNWNWFTKTPPINTPEFYSKTSSTWSPPWEA